MNNVEKSAVTRSRVQFRKKHNNAPVLRAARLALFAHAHFNCLVFVRLPSNRVSLYPPSTPLSPPLAPRNDSPLHRSTSVHVESCFASCIRPFVLPHEVTLKRLPRKFPFCSSWVSSFAWKLRSRKFSTNVTGQGARVRRTVANLRYRSLVGGGTVPWQDVEISRRWNVEKRDTTDSFDARLYAVRNLLRVLVAAAHRRDAWWLRALVGRGHVPGAGRRHVEQSGVGRVRGLSSKSGGVVVGRVEVARGFRRTSRFYDWIHPTAV